VAMLLGPTLALIVFLISYLFFPFFFMLDRCRCFRKMNRIPIVVLLIILYPFALVLQIILSAFAIIPATLAFIAFHISVIVFLTFMLMRVSCVGRKAPKS